jgi:signal peptidase I
MEPFFLLAQYPPDGGFVERLARASYSSVLIFASVCTLIHLTLHLLLEGNPHSPRRSVISIVLSLLRGIAESLVYASIIVFFLIRPYGIQTFKIPSESMLDALKPNDVLLVNKWVYRVEDPKFGEVVVFKPPKEALEPEQDPNTDFVKRLIGEPGDVIEIRDGKLYRNGVQIEEPYVRLYARKFFPGAPPEPVDYNEIPFFKLVAYNGRYYSVIRDRERHTHIHPPASSHEELHRIANLPPAPIPKGHYLMLGDNRNNSKDGRYWGLIERHQVVGRAWRIVWPPSRWGRVK